MTPISPVDIFDRVCDEHDIEQGLTKIKHPWTNDLVQRMNRTIKEGEADQKMIRWIIFPLNVKRFGDWRVWP